MKKPDVQLKQQMKEKISKKNILYRGVPAKEPSLNGRWSRVLLSRYSFASPKSTQ